MNIRDYYQEMFKRIIELQSDKFEDRQEFCCGKLVECKVLETEKLELIVDKKSKALELYRKENGNPVIYRSGSGEIYRCHGEAGYLKAELTRLSGWGEEFLNPEYKYD